jgi:excinuclease UvrABC nuclease subunit
MLGIKRHDYAWNKSWIEFKAPNAQGVYCLKNKERQVLFIGKGNVRERLLGHWNRENSIDALIWEYLPYMFSFQVTDKASEFEAELIKATGPLCNARKRTPLYRFW